MNTRASLSALLALTLSSAFIVRGAETVPLIDGLSPHTHPVTTASKEAQQYFDQGLRLVFGFNHGAAIRSFQEAVRRDPQCAMAHWGIALACGPHINLPLVPPPAAELAWKELTLAQQYAGKASAVEQSLVDALRKRYANPQPEDRSALDKAYADAMREVWKKYSTDADVGVLFAESLMDLRPWDQWTREGAPQPGTEEILATLDAVLKLEVNHPFANHLYIHAVEASSHPERALAAADRLRDLQPNLAHNVHMPSHIDIRTGQWKQAITANLKAIDAASRMRVAFGPPKGPIVIYNAHNRQMLTWAAMMTGQSKLALQQVRTMVAEIPQDDLKEFAFVAEGMTAMPYEVLIRFGQWDEILSGTDLPDWMPLSRGLRLAARGIALAAKGETRAARTEQLAYAEAVKKVPAGEALFNNPAAKLIAVTTPMLEGEILVREGHLEEGLAQLRVAVQAEDALNYDEPPGWILPVRHSLGATLMSHERFAEAEQVYRADLQHTPKNGWSLFGLSEALKRQHKGEEAKRVREQFDQIWANADLVIGSSCFCQPGQ